MVITIILAVIVAVIAGIVGQKSEQKKHDQAIQQAQQQAGQMVHAAEKEAKQVAEEVVTNGKTETENYQASIDEELDSYEADNRIRQSRIDQRTNGVEQVKQRLDKMHNELAERQSELDDIQTEIDKLAVQAEQLANKRRQVLQDNGDLSYEEAARQITDQLAIDLDREREVELRYQNDEAKVIAPKMAKQLADDAIQRGPVDYPREHVEHSVVLPDQGTKQKLLGKENINLRYIETLTGVDIVFDRNEPLMLHVVTSDPLRREIARTVIGNLMVTRQINSQTIEQQVDTVSSNLMSEIRKTGEDVATSLHIGFVHPDEMKLIGRLRYRTSYGQNVLTHSIEVAKIAGILAAEFGLDVQIAKRAGLFHDIGKAIDHDIDSTHVELGVQIAQQYDEDEQVVNSIASHHGDVDVTTPIANLVAAGDSISGGRQGARSESAEEYINRLRSLEKIAGQKPGVKDSFAIQAGREIRVMVDPNQINDEKNQELAAQISNQIENELTYPGKIKVTLIRSFKAVSYVGAEKKKKKKRA
ncbi:ribonuclease Y [Lentilactobacillus sp. SPB1-3]|uniref:Ribonuclease Y n=1 Tax=Lentilactobacillus terminaliae TaxID=3003483 RepID=A0ACD5DFA5_9LACO|nr:ribonuclease Y [Lentilactobacillus sp. SPB1-3]MCZ0977523.1 ribonuclease Y [Lentilactobacillus sp. SPB1-3]